MKSYYILFFILCNSFFALGQNEYLFSVKNEKGEKLPYASISWGKGSKGISANENGFAKIVSVNLIDTIHASSVGYPIKHLIISELQKIGDTLNITLIQQKNILPPITVFSNEKITEVGIVETETSFISNKYRNVIAAVEVQQPGSLCKIKTVSVFISRKSDKNVPFRIRVFGKNSLGQPEHDFLTSNVVCNSYKINDWNNVSLEDNNVFMDLKEFFIAIEWLNITDNNIKNNDLQIGLTNKNSKAITQFKFPNQPWKILGHPDLKFDNIMLKTTLIN
jgi:hypothetical protein